MVIRKKLTDSPRQNDQRDPFEGMMLNPEDYPALIQKRAAKTQREINAEAVRIKLVRLG